MTARESQLVNKLDSFSERFWENVNRTGADDCWLWTASCTPKGYGQFKINGVGYNSHRIAWILSNGEIPDYQYVLHRCDTPPCVNLRHLFLGTQSDNIQDAIQKGRWNSNYDNNAAQGEAHYNAHLTECDIRDIRELAESGMHRGILAIRFGVSTAHIYSIIRSERWGHI